MKTIDILWILTQVSASEMEGAPPPTRTLQGTETRRSIQREMLREVFRCIEVRWSNGPSDFQRASHINFLQNPSYDQLGRYTRFAARDISAKLLRNRRFPKLLPSAQFGNRGGGTFWSRVGWTGVHLHGVADGVVLVAATCSIWEHRSAD